eukprot:2059117-Rhodomonas_salina.5
MAYTPMVCPYVSSGTETAYAPMYAPMFLPVQPAGAFQSAGGTTLRVWCYAMSGTDISSGPQ